MPRVTLKNKELIDNLTYKLNNDPFRFTIRDYFELEAAESDQELEDYLIDINLKRYIDNLPNKDQSIILCRESSLVYLILDHLNLLNDLNIKKVLSVPRSIHIFEASSGDINFTILHQYEEELWIFSNDDINKLKVLVKNTILSRLLTDIKSIRPIEVDDLTRSIISIIKLDNHE